MSICRLKIDMGMGMAVLSRLPGYVAVTAVNTAVIAVFTAVMEAIAVVVPREWGQTPREYRGDGVRVCGIPAVMGTGGNYSISKQTQCCKIHKTRSLAVAVGPRERAVS